MNCVSPRQERSSPLALTECIGLLSGALVHLPTTNGKAAEGREGSTGLCVEERKEWQHVGYKFIVSHGPAGAGTAAARDCRDGGSELGILLCDGGDERPSVTTIASTLSQNCATRQQKCVKLPLPLKHQNENQMTWPPQEFVEQSECSEEER